MKSLITLRGRLLHDNTLSVQTEKGYLHEAGFKWNVGASDEEIVEFQSIIKFSLPASYIDFIHISNGALLYKDLEYEQWGCQLLGLKDIITITNRKRELGFAIPGSWVVFATWLGDCDLLLFDLERYKSGDKRYIIDGDTGYPVSEWDFLKGDFEDWLDRLIVAQGAKYWRWYFW